MLSSSSKKIRLFPANTTWNQTLGKVSAATGQNTIGEWNMDGKSIEFAVESCVEQK
jgi:hypothetical protein